MKNLFLLTACAFVLVLQAAAQTTAVTKKPGKNSDTFQLGSKTVRIPPPAGFTDVMGRIPNTKQLYARNDPNSFIAIAVPAAVFPKLQADPLMPLDFYAVVAVTDAFKVLDMTPELFASYVATYEKDFSSYLDPKGPVVAEARKNIDTIRSQATGERSNANFSGTKNLGFFQKTDKVFSAMFLMTLEVNIFRKLPTVVTFSVMRINDRLITLGVYKSRPTAKDLDTIPAFTKKWTAAVIAANR